MGTDTENKEVSMTQDEAIDDSYNELFLKASAEISGQDFDPERHKEPEKDDAPTVEDEPIPEDKAKPDETDVSDEEIKEPEAEDEASKEPDTKEEVAAKDEETDFDSLSDTFKQELELLRHKEKSFSGRHRSWTQERQKLKAEKAALEKALSEATREEVVIPQTDEVKELSETLPHVGKAVEAQVRAGVEAAMAENAKDNSPTPDNIDEGHEVDMEAEAAKLTQEIPNWKEVINDPHWGTFMETLPPEFVKLANSDYAEDAIYLIKNVYDPYLSKLEAEADAPSDDTSTEAQPDKGSNSEAADKAKARRDKALEANQEIDSKGAARQITEGEEGSAYDRMFAQAAKNIVKKRESEGY